MNFALFYRTSLVIIPLSGFFNPDPITDTQNKIHLVGNEQVWY